MNGAYHSSPFGSPRQPLQQHLPKNYTEVFDERDYECKSDIELESYARNLSNYLNRLLTDMPFPAVLFEKLETRLNGILSMLKKRCAARGVSTTKQAAEERLKRMTASLDAVSTTQPLSPEPEDCEDHRPAKKRKFEFNAEIRRELKAERVRKANQEKEEEEEEVDIEN